MTLGIMQPYFMPYIGYFQLMKAVDRYVVYDDVNYIKRGWVNRNNILVNGEKRMFTITLKKASQNKLFNEIVIGDDFEKLMKMLRMNYSKAINFDETMTLMERIISFPDIQSPNQKIPDRKTKCVIKTHINIKQNVIFSAKLKPV